MILLSDRNNLFVLLGKSYLVKENWRCASDKAHLGLPLGAGGSEAVPALRLPPCPLLVSLQLVPLLHLGPWLLTSP